MTGTDVVVLLTVVVVLNLWGATSVIILSFGGKKWCAMLSLGAFIFCLTVLIVIRFGEEFQPAVAKLTQ